MKKVLVIVDVQKDFYHPDGALYVKGGEVLPERIAKVIPQFNKVVFTADWHPINHCSFKENGGIWPIHCVEFTEGASFPKEFTPYIKNNVVIKGECYEEEEYGAPPFNIINYSGTWIDEGYEIVFCGIAGDYCLRETIDLMIAYKKIRKSLNYPHKEPNKISVYLDGVASIDDGATLRKFMEENNIGEWKPEE